MNLAIPADAHHNVTKILDFMLVGGDDISTNLVILKEHNVKTIVNATTDGEETFPGTNFTTEIQATHVETLSMQRMCGMTMVGVCRACCGLDGCLTEKSGILYLKLNWKDEADQPILADLERAFECIGRFPIPNVG